MNIIATKDTGVPVSKLPVEIVERKGKGHPDVICDKAVEEFSIALSEFYIENFGRILHHNVDKCVLVGGKSKCWFGGGVLLDPIYLLLVGRAENRILWTDENGQRDIFKVPLGRLALECTRKWIAEDFAYLKPDTHIITDYKVRSGSPDLVKHYQAGPKIPMANDTSFGVAFAPLSELEQIVYKTETLLNSDKTRKSIPAIGEDIKVMGVRKEGNIHITVAIAMVSPETKNLDEYLDAKDRAKDVVLDLVAKETDKPVHVTINAADVIKSKTDMKQNTVYLTVTGTSAEHGDDGQVGRGNRANGLITPYRPMTLEACAGKNPISHVGKIYNVAAKLIAERVYKETEVDSVSCYMVSSIGCPITEPQVVDIQVQTEQNLNDIKTTASSIAENVLNELPNLWKGIIERKYNLF